MDQGLSHFNTQRRDTLLKRVRDTGDQTSWREFDAVYRPLLECFVRRLGLRDGRVEDALQEIFLKLARLMPNFKRDEKRKFRKYLHTVARSVVVDIFRKSDGMQLLHPEGSADRPPEPAAPEEEDHFEHEYRQFVLQASLSRVKDAVTPEAWISFEEYLVKGRTAQEVAAELGIERGTLQTRASRVLKTLREQCEEFMLELGDGD